MSKAGGPTETVKRPRTSKQEKPPTVVHLGTQIQTVFGVVDDDGNVTPQEPISGQMVLFSKAEFAKAFDAISEARDKAAETIPETED